MNFKKNKYKTMFRLIKKFFSLLTSAVTVLIISGFLSLQPVSERTAVYAHHTDNPTACKDITLSSNPANRTLTAPMSGANGINSGQFDLNALQHDSQACITQSAAAPYAIKGWAWNTNVGLVSMYCQAGSNFGSGCGAFNYGVSVQTVPGQDANVTGFAYGDAMGWVSMRCSGGTNNGTACGGVDYGVKMAMTGGNKPGCASTQPGDLYGYAWTDSVGWVNFCGAHGVVPAIDSEVPPTVVAGVTRTAIQNGQPVVQGEGNGENVYANGRDYYRFSVQVTRDNVPIINGVTITPEIATNTVKRDQVTPCDEACTYTAIQATNFVFDNTENKFVSDVKSFAPTNNDNTYNITGLTVAIQGVQAAVYVPINTGNLTFMPPFEVSSIQALDQQPNSIEVTPDEELPITITATWLTQDMEVEGMQEGINSTKVYAQLYDCTSDYDFVFHDANGAGEPLAPGQADSEFPYYQKSGVCGENQTLVDSVDFAVAHNVGSESDTQIFGQLAEGVEAPLADSGRLVALQTIVEIDPRYGANDIVRYYSMALNNSNTFSQAASIQGNVSIDIINTAGLPIDAAGKIGQSLGEGVQETREKYSRAIESVLRSAQPRQINGNTVELNQNVVDQIADDVLYYKRTGDAPCSISLADNDDIGLQENKTIISVGCNIYIKKNIRAHDGRSGRLGIIALEDLTMDGINRGGNVYLCSQVTDLEANLVLDKGLLSYNGGADCSQAGAIDDNGLPITGGDYRNALRNQFALTGSIISSNTYGGSVGEVKRFGDGRIATTPEEVAQARLYDLNYLRYGKVETNQGELCWANDVLLSKTITNSPEQDPFEICATIGNNPTLKSTVTIIYRAPSPTQPIFSSVNN